MQIVLKPEIKKVATDGGTSPAPGVMSTSILVSFDDADLREIFACGEGAVDDELFAKVFREFCARPISEWLTIYAAMAKQREEAARVAKNLAVKVGAAEPKSGSLDPS